MRIDETRLKLASDILQMSEEELQERLMNQESKDHIKPRLSVKQTEQITGVSYFTLRRQIKLGNLKATRIGRSLKFDPNDVQAFLEKCKEV